MKHLLLLFLLIPSLSFAFQPEISLGYSSFQKPSNGLWYQEGLPYKLNLTSGSIGLGLKLDLGERLKLHLGYKYLGSISSDAQASASDANYAAWKAGTATLWPTSHFTGKGDLQGIYSLASYDWTHLYITGGVWVHRSSWTETIPDWRYDVNNTGTPSAPQYLQVKCNSKPRIDPVGGLGYKLTKNLSIEYTIWKARNTAQYPLASGNYIQNLGLIYTF